MTARTTPGPWKVYHENGSMGSGGHWGVESLNDPAEEVDMARAAIAAARGAK